MRQHVSDVSPPVVSCIRSPISPLFSSPEAVYCDASINKHMRAGRFRFRNPQQTHANGEESHVTYLYTSHLISTKYILYLYIFLCGRMFRSVSRFVGSACPTRQNCPWAPAIVPSPRVPCALSSSVLAAHSSFLGVGRLRLRRNLVVLSFACLTGRPMYSFFGLCLKSRPPAALLLLLPLLRVRG